MTAPRHTHGLEHPSTHGHLHVPGSTLAHRIAPEAKLIGLFAFVVIVALTPRRPPVGLAIDLGVVAALLVAARIPPKVVLARSVVVVPFLVFAILLPFIGGGPTTQIGPLSLSTAGLWSAWSIGAKAGCGVAASVVVTATTPVASIIDGLSKLRLPTLVVAILAFMFRYLDLVSDRLARMRQSMVSRCYQPRWWWHAKPVASAAGAVFVRSYERGERIHQAMLARGFTGAMPNLNPRATRWSDIGVALVPAALALIAAAWTVSS